MLSSILKQKKLNNLIFFNYVPELDKFMYWKQQLISESLGKKGKGFLPTVSKAPKDHHSLLQLYLDGPKDKIFYIFSAEEPVFKVAIPTGGPKVTSMIWSGLDDLLLTGHDTGDLVQWDVKTQKKLKLTTGKSP